MDVLNVVETSGSKGLMEAGRMAWWVKALDVNTNQRPRRWKEKTDL